MSWLLLILIVSMHGSTMKCYKCRLSVTSWSVIWTVTYPSAENIDCCVYY